MQEDIAARKHVYTQPLNLISEKEKREKNIKIKRSREIKKILPDELILING